MTHPPDPHKKRCPAKGTQILIAKPEPNKDSAPEKNTQPETAIASAIRAALARKAVRP
jgi:hypothetical protein